MSHKLTGDFTSSSSSASFIPNLDRQKDNSGVFRVWLDFATGSGAGTVKLQSQPETSSTWYDDALGVYSFTSDGFFDFQSFAPGTKYRLTCVHTSGTISYVLES